MSIKNLIAALPPPAAPAFAFNGSWETIEAELGTPLPEDYKDIVRVYGDGVYLNLLFAYMPIGESDHVTLIPQVYRVQKIFSEDYGPLMYPRPGGLLGCGETHDGDYIFWLTRGPVSEWPIVVWDRGASEEEKFTTFECDLTDFIAGLVTGSLRFPGFGDEEVLSDCDQLFRPGAEGVAEPTSSDDRQPI